MADIRPDTQATLHGMRREEMKSGKATENIAEAVGDDIAAVIPDKPGRKKD
jgi:hypothetical protein